ncbi:Peptide chain release factor 1, mitochondrial [Saitoella coloradoensis]
MASTAAAETKTEEAYQAGELSPALRMRAKRLRSQYNALKTRANAEAADGVEFNKETIALNKRISDLEDVSNALQALEDAERSIEELQKEMNSTTDPDMKTMAREDMEATVGGLVKLKEELTTALTPKHPHAHLPALLEIRSGIGGDEASLFAHDLLKMYERYCAIEGMQFKVMSINRSDSSGEGLSEAIIQVSSPGAFGKLRGEAGVHRVQRNPATDAKGRVHTSTAAVNVLAEISEQDAENDELAQVDMREVKIDVMRARGAGGQHVNKTESAVRLTHLPTGITISMQDSRSQHANRAKALLVLRSRLAARRREANIQREKNMRRAQGTVSRDRSDKVRTYNWPQNRITDHRCGYSMHDLTGAMEGRVAGLIEEVGRWMRSQELEEAMAADREASAI